MEQEAQVTEPRGFTSSRPWRDVGADCIVIMCSDQRFREPALEFVQHLGYHEPHVISLPSGVAIAHSLTAALGFLSKALHKLLSKAIDVTGVKDVICIAHEDCGGYKAGQVKLIGDVTRRLRGKSVDEIQRIHLERAARDLHYALPDVRVRTFYADVVEVDAQQRVRFEEVPVGTRRRRTRISVV